MRKDIRALLPESESISDSKILEETLKIWELTLKQSPWQLSDLKDIPFTLLITTKDSLVEHTRRVTRMAMAIAKERNDLNEDYVIAGGLLHDVGKLLEYEPGNRGVQRSKYGELIRHPVSGGSLVLQSDLPLELAHIIIAHSTEGEKVERTQEAILIHHCDFIDFEIAKINNLK